MSLRSPEAMEHEDVTRQIKCMRVKWCLVKRKLISQGQVSLQIATNHSRKVLNNVEWVKHHYGKMPRPFLKGGQIYSEFFEGRSGP